MARDRIVFLLDGVNRSIIRSCRYNANAHHMHQIRRIELAHGLRFSAEVRFYGPKLLLLAASPELDYDGHCVLVLRYYGAHIPNEMGRQAAKRVFPHFEEMQQKCLNS